MAREEADENGLSASTNIVPMSNGLGTNFISTVELVFSSIKIVLFNEV